jgi:hypothetical protein
MQNSPYTCPFCRAGIGMNDVNVATDVALCRSCGKTMSFAMIAGPAQIDMDLLDKPPKGIKVQREYGGGTAISYHRLSPALFFLIPFTAAWSGFSMAGIYGSQLREGKFDMAASLFGLPFLFGTCVLLTVIAYLLFGKLMVAMRDGKGLVFVGIGPIGWTRRFQYDRSSIVSMRLTNISHNHVRQQGICVRTDGKDFTFGTMLKDDAKEYVAAAIMREVSNMM